MKRKKIRIVRWKTRKVAEYDLDSNTWSLTDTTLSSLFLPYSRTVYLPNTDLLTLGGLDETIPSKPVMSTRMEMVSEVGFNGGEEKLYIGSKKAGMRKGRGCFCCCYMDEMVYAIGGVSMEEGVMGSCEKYSIERDSWYEISDLPLPLKNSSVCPLTSDTLYVFGGTTSSGLMSDTIL